MVEVTQLKFDFNNTETVAIEFAKWLKKNYRIEKGRYRHRGDFFRNDKKLKDEKQLFQDFKNELTNIQ